jgi:hypothetical protein
MDTVFEQINRPEIRCIFPNTEKRYSSILNLQGVRCNNYATFILFNIVTYRPVAKHWLCKQRPLLDNARNIHERNNRTALCNAFISNGSVNTPTTIGVLLEPAFSIPSVQCGYEEEFSWEPAVEFRCSKQAVSRELGRWSWEFRLGVLTSGQRRYHGSWRISLCRSRCQETASGDCNRLRTLVCVCDL